MAAAAVTVARLTIEKPRGLWAISPQPAASQLWFFARDQFGEREVLLVAVQLPRSSALRADTVTAALERWIGDQPEVSGVFGMQSVRRLRRGVGFLVSRQRQQQWRELRSTILSPDSSVIVTYVTLVLPPDQGSHEVKTSFLSRLRQQSAELLPEGTELLLAGQPALDVALVRLLRVEIKTAVPLALACITLVLVITIGTRAMAPALAVLASVIVQLGGLAATGVPISSATTVAFPLTVIVGLSYGVHMTLAIDRMHSAHAAIREIGPPLGWSYVTTAVALGSLSLSPIYALRLFAYVSTAGVTLAFLAAFTLVPQLQTRSRSRWSVRGRALLTRPAIRFFGLAAGNPVGTLVVWTAVGIIAAVGLSRVTVEPNSHLGFFSDDDPIVFAHKTLDQAFNGSVSLELLVDTDSGVAARQPRVQQRIRDFARVATEQLGVGPMFAPLDQRLLRYDSVLVASIRDWFEGRDPRYTRAVFSMPVVPTAEARAVVQSLNSIATAHSDAAVRIRVTGQLPSSIPMLRALVDSQVRSLGVLLAVVTVFLALAARSATVGLILLIPNALSLASVAGAMGYLGIPIDFVTVTVCSLVLGVAVDDTLQITWAMRRTDAAGMKYLAPLALRRTAGPVSLASIAMIAGCVALLLSPFPPTRHLGGLLAIGLTTALVADLTLTPLLLSRANKHSSER